MTRTGRPPIYGIRSDYFAELTPDSAYVVGLMQADGSNRLDRGMMTITLKRTDAPLLEVISVRMAGGRPLLVNRDGNSTLQVQNRPLSYGLAAWGVVSPKTHTASTHPALLLDRDYWRGVVDGDGTLCDTADGRKILAVVGSEAICEQFLAFCRHHGTGGRCNVHRNRSIYTAKLSGPDAAHLAGDPVPPGGTRTRSQARYRDPMGGVDMKAYAARGRACSDCRCRWPSTRAAMWVSCGALHPHPQRAA